MPPRVMPSGPGPRTFVPSPLILFALAFGNSGCGEIKLAVPERIRPVPIKPIAFEAAAPSTKPVAVVIEVEPAMPRKPPVAGAKTIAAATRPTPSKI